MGSGVCVHDLEKAFLQICNDDNLEVVSKYSLTRHKILGRVTESFLFSLMNSGPGVRAIAGEGTMLSSATSIYVKIILTNVLDHNKLKLLGMIYSTERKACLGWGLFESRRLKQTFAIARV